MLSLLNCTATARAQEGYNYSRFDLGAGGAYTMPNTDFLKPINQRAFNLNFTYNYSPFINYVAEMQIGKLAADSLRGNNGSSFTNRYTAFSLRLQLQAGEWMDYSNSKFKNALKNFYIGTGVGMMFSNTSRYADNNLLEQQNKSDIFIPVKAGYEFKVFNSYNEPWMKVDFGYQFNYSLSDKLDGFKSGNSSDSFGQIVAGIRIAVGSTISYKKQINYTW